jgi:hypothetical protein
MIRRFAIEFLKVVAILVALPLASGVAVLGIVFSLSDRDVGGAMGSSLAGIAAGLLGLVIAITIVVRRIADIED